MGKTSKAILTLMTAAALAMPGQVMAADYPNLELLVSNHIKQSDRLLERTGEKAAATAQAKDELKKSDKYTDVAKELHKRGGDLLGYAVFGAEMVNVASKVTKIARLEKDVIDEVLAGGLTYPYLTKYAVETEIEVGNRLAEVTMYSYYILVASAGVGLATQEQRMTFVSNIKTALEEIEWILHGLLRKCQMAKVLDAQTRQMTIKEWYESFERIRQEVLDKEKKEIDNMFKEG